MPVRYASGGSDSSPGQRLALCSGPFWTCGSPPLDRRTPSLLDALFLCSSCLPQEPDRIYLVLEHCSGGDLSAHIKRCGRVGEPFARKCLRQLADGLRELRRHNLVHVSVFPTFGFSQSPAGLRRWDPSFSRLHDLFVTAAPPCRSWPA